jgi:hypothetical protein
MKRSGYLKRTTPLRPGKPTKRKGRSADEKARIYGTPEHQAWLREHPCLVCWTLPVELAHTANGGTGRKGDAKEQAPLCSGHHRESHQIGVASFEQKYAVTLQGRTLKEWAATLARAWERHQSGLTHVSAIVPGVVSSLLARASKESA